MLGTGAPLRNAVGGGGGGGGIPRGGGGGGGGDDKALEDGGGGGGGGGMPVGGGGTCVDKGDVGDCGLTSETVRGLGAGGGGGDDIRSFGLPLDAEETEDGGGGGGGATPFLKSPSVMYCGFFFRSSCNFCTSARRVAISSSLADNASTALAAIFSASMSRTCVCLGSALRAPESLCRRE